ncbi:hypothetical protein ACPV5E_25475, partial [Vibrio mediterranei]
MQWISAYSRLFSMLDKTGSPAYHSGSAFIKVVQQFDRGLPGYSLYIEERNRLKQSTTRRDFYWDILQNLDESTRFEVYWSNGTGHFIERQSMLINKVLYDR